MRTKLILVLIALLMLILPAVALADTGGGGLSGGEFAGTILILAGVVLLRRARRSGRGADGSGSAARGA